MFNRLLKLFPKFGNTPLENFTTEVLASILENNQEILQIYVNDFLGIIGSNFKVSTQESHKLENTKHIDLVIKNNDTICFVENKIEAPEGKEQLENYIKILKNLQSNKVYKNIVLVYCTKYIEHKNIKEKNLTFINKRWNDLYNHFKKHESIKYVSEFTNYLLTQKMAIETNITQLDIEQLKTLPMLLGKIEEFKQIIIAEFKKSFKNPKEPEGLKRIIKNNDYIVFLENIYGSAYSEIGTGIMFRQGEPSFCIWLYTLQNTFEKQIEGLKTKKELNIEDISKTGFLIRKPLSDFINNENVTEILKKWMSENLKILQQYINESSDNNWNKDLLQPLPLTNSKETPRK